MTTELRPQPAPEPTGPAVVSTSSATVPIGVIAALPCPDGGRAQTRTPRCPVASRQSGLNVYYGDFRAIRDISLTVKPHAITAIIGPSGCGKSTFLGRSTGCTS